MKIERNTSSYNERRYGKPYIAKIDFSDSVQGTPTWGDWIGHPGQDGVLIIDANPGDVIMKGQKDFRNNRNSAPDYGIVQLDGSITWLASKAAAYKSWKASLETQVA